jgi:hypothetical protein
MKDEVCCERGKLFHRARFLGRRHRHGASLPFQNELEISGGGGSPGSPESRRHDMRPCIRPTDKRRGSLRRGVLLEYDLEGLLKTGFCRISIPRYLFTAELAGDVIGKLDDMLKYMNYYVRCYQIGKDDSWEVRPEITSIPPVKETQEPKKSCCSGPSGSFTKDRGEDDPLAGGMIVIDWLIPDIWKKIIARKLTDRFLEDPDRWFLHPEDLRKTDSGI